MEAVLGFVAGVVVFMHGLQLFGLSESKTTGIVAALGAIALVALMALSPLPMLTKAEAAGFAPTVLLWATYAALVAGVGLWGFGARGLGLYSAWGFVGMIVQVIYCAAIAFSLTGLVCGVVQAVAFAMLYLHLGLRRDALKRATAWVLVVVGPIHGILSILLSGGFAT